MKQNAERPRLKTFISYSRNDIAFVEKLAAALEDTGFAPLIDKQDIAPGEPWEERLGKLIASADTVLFVISPNSILSKHCTWEVAETERLGKRLLPVVWRPVPDQDVPERLRRLNYIFFDGDHSFTQALTDLSQALTTDFQWIREHTRLSEMAERWNDALGTRARGLLTGTDIDDAEYWLERHPPSAPQPTSRQQAFIVTSRRAERLAQQRKLRARVSIVVLTASIISVAVFSYAGLLDRSYVKIQGAKLMDIYLPSVLSAEAELGLRPGDRFRECVSCPEMIVIASGEFMMGSLEGEGRDDEHPQHRVVIAKPFAISIFEVSFDQWDSCVAHGGCVYEGKGERWGRGLQPVTRVSWNDANSYTKWLSKQTGKTYRLLTEAEWEYAARAGTQTRYAHGDDEQNLDSYAWYNANSLEHTHVVGSKTPNRLGIHDLHGNVWEWVQDCYVDNYNEAPENSTAVVLPHCTHRSLRGGSWLSKAEDLRPAARYGYIATFRNDSNGFRVARTLRQE